MDKKLNKAPKGSIKDGKNQIPLNANSQLNVVFPRYNPPYYSTNDLVPNIETEKQPLQDEGSNK